MIASAAKDTGLVTRFRSPHADLAPSTYHKPSPARLFFQKPVPKTVDRKIIPNGPVAE